MFHLSGEGKGKQTEPDAVLRDVLDDEGVAQLKKVLKVGVGTRLARHRIGLPAP